MTTTANTTDYGFTVAHAAGSDTGHIVEVTGTYYGAYAPAAVCGTSPRIRYSSTRWFSTDENYATPAAAAAARPGAMCKRCMAVAARIAAATPAPEVTAPAESLEENTMTTPAAAADIHPRAVDLAAMVTPGATRVDLDPATAPTASYRTASAVVTAYFQGGPGRGDCIDSVIVTVTGGDSHPARNFAALDAIRALEARVTGPVTAGEYQTIASGDRDVIFIYGTWTD